MSKLLGFFFLFALDGKVFGEDFYGLGRLEKIIPQVYQSWLPWILSDLEELRCPINEQLQSHECLLYGTFNLSMNHQGGTFIGSVESFKEHFVQLPGSDKYWPQQVKVNNEPKPVISFQGSPAVAIGAGKQVIEGAFRWTQIPVSLPLPPKMFHIKLTLNDLEIYPKRDAKGEIWLHTLPDSTSKSDNSFALQIHRLYLDSVPASLTTEFSIKVSGLAREIDLGKVLPEGFFPRQIDANIPTELSENGNLKLKVHGGTHKIIIYSYNRQNIDKVKIPERNSTEWPEFELWAIAEDLTNRSLEIMEASIDPSQTQFPKQWSSYPLYSLAPGAELNLSPKPVSKFKPISDHLSLNRTLWLDSSGKNYTFRDEIVGQVQKSWRLNMSTDYNLGKAEVNSVPSVITDVGGKPGVEVREAEITLKAEGRTYPKDGKIKATGWETSFEKMSMLLYTPPGWRVLYASGVDQLSSSWLKSWNLLNIFLLCLVFLSVLKIYGPLIAALGLVALCLLIPEQGSPKWIWLFVILLAGFQKVAERLGRFQYLLRYSQVVISLMLFFFLTAFSIPHLKAALHPILEEPISLAGSDLVSDLTPTLAKGILAPPEVLAPSAERKSLPMTPPSHVPTPNPEDTVEAEAAMEAALPQEAKNKTLQEIPPSPMSAQQKISAAQIATQGSLAPLFQSNKYQSKTAFQPQVNIQTGFGVPSRNWNQYQLSWDGPVGMSHSLRVFFLSPLEAQILAFLRVGLASLFAFLLIKIGFFEQKISL